MSESESETTAAIPSEEPDAKSAPPSLMRRGPTQLLVTDKSALSPSMTPRWVHVQAGRHIRIQVVPPSRAAKVTIVASAPLLAVVPTTSFEDAGVTTYYTEITGHSHGHFSILPAPGKLHISIDDHLPEPWRITIPIAIWPKKLTLFVCFLITFFTLFWARVHSIISHNATVGEMLTTASEDLPALLACFTISGLSMAAVRLMGWVVLIPEALEGE
ncbi:hypothetical protein BH10PLA2_BH10PLA2_05900 [soil metagenome]